MSLGSLYPDSNGASRYHDLDYHGSRILNKVFSSFGVEIGIVSLYHH